MKGQEEILTLVLVIMIVVAIVTLAYAWFSGIFSQLMTAARSAITRTSTVMSTQFKIENAAFVSGDQQIYVTIRNVGKQPFDITKTAFYVNEISADSTFPDCPYCSCTVLAQGCIAKFNVTGIASLPAKSKLKATIETGLEDIRDITIVS